MSAPSFRQRLQRGERLVGTFLNSGSPLMAEIAGQAGLDWCLLDLEHGMGSWETLPLQLMGLEGTGATALVRLPGLDLAAFKKALDCGAQGVMLPNIASAEEAAQAVSYSRFPPHGVRGVAGLNRGARYGTRLMERLENAHEDTVVVVQIESPEAVANVDAIAAVEGVDALFVGPMDLTVSLGIPREFEHPLFVEACAAVVAAARAAGKASGILLAEVANLEASYGRGFTLVAVNSETGLVARGMAEIAATHEKHKSMPPEETT